MENIVIASAAVLRVAGFISGYKPELGYLDSPYTSIKSLEEGESYLKNGFSPYFQGSPVHSPPILLHIYMLIPRFLYFSLLLTLELHSVYLLKRITNSSKSTLLLYLNPFAFYMIFNLSSSILSIWTILLFVYFTIKSESIKSGLALSLVIYLDPSSGIVSSLWYFKHKTFRPYFFTLTSLVGLKLLSDYLSGPGWISSCQVSYFFMHDIHPSFGLRWYLMLEMFKKYQLMYSVMVAVHTWIYVYPLTAILNKFYRYSKYEKIDELYLVILLSIVYINHPHPTLFEYLLVVSLFLVHEELVLSVKSGFFTICSWVIGNILSCFMWKIWTERMGGNANFFYFQTIFSNFVAIGFIVALLYQIVENTKNSKIKKLCQEIVIETLQNHFKSQGFIKEK